MLKIVCSAIVLSLSSALLTAAPASIYGKALQRARNVASHAEQSRTLPPEKPAPAAAQPVDRLALAKEFSQAIIEAKLKRYPASGAAGINKLFSKKAVQPRIFGKDIKLPVSEKDLPIAWFGSEANRAGKEVFPLFITKPAFGPVIVGFTDGKVILLKQKPRTVTGAVHILRSTAGNKKSPLWKNYQKTAGAIDRASK